MKKIFLGALLLGMGFTYYSCILPYPTESELYNDVATVTQRDTLEDFGRFHTFAISDSVYWIGTDSSINLVKQEYSIQLVNEFVSHMTSRGYVRVAASEDPDLVVNMTAAENLYIVYSPGYGYGYWDCYYWYYPCDWWYYPTYPTISSYKTASLVIDLVDRRDAIDHPDLGYLTIPWTAVVYTLNNNNTSFNIQKGLIGIDQAFDQSPYLTTN